MKYPAAAVLYRPAQRKKTKARSGANTSPRRAECLVHTLWTFLSTVRFYA
jgi:hypothetical protein